MVPADDPMEVSTIPNDAECPNISIECPTIDDGFRGLRGRWVMATPLPSTSRRGMTTTTTTTKAKAKAAHRDGGRTGHGWMPQEARDERDDDGERDGDEDEAEDWYYYHDDDDDDDDDAAVASAMGAHCGAGYYSYYASPTSSSSLSTGRTAQVRARIRDSVGARARDF